MEFSNKELLHLCFIPELGSHRIRLLLNTFRTFDRLSRAPLNEMIKVNGIDIILAKRIQKGIGDNKLALKAEKQIALLEKHNAEIITCWNDAYPENLKTIYNPPVLLFVKGTLSDGDKHSVALVGTRTVTDYGRIAADRLAKDLAVGGITVISGMATGVDSFAHWGAIKAGGRTIAVLGCGVDIVYPAENNSLYKEIIEYGAVISELPFGTKPSRGTFPARNRIISGMSLGTVVIEAGKKSGALITAAAALEQNREVFAVPGNISSIQCEGTNRLIRDGAAKLVLTADDIIEELGPGLKQRLKSIDSGEPPENLTENETKVYLTISYEPEYVDNIAGKSGLSPSELAGPLLTLELKGLIRRLPGSKYVRL